MYSVVLQPGPRLRLTPAVMEAASLCQAAAYLHLLRDFIAAGKLLLFRSKRLRKGAAGLLRGVRRQLPTHNNGFSIVNGKVDDNMSFVF